MITHFLKLKLQLKKYIFLFIITMLNLHQKREHRTEHPIKLVILHFKLYQS